MKLASILNGVQVATTNLFDQDPPFFLNAINAGSVLYDPTGANAFGRVITLKLTKAW